MEWINVFGLFYIIIIMIPNIVFAVRCKDGFENRWNNRLVETLEQFGRFGCFAFMVLNIPRINEVGWCSKDAFVWYLFVDAFLVLSYCIIWIISWKKNGVFRALALSIIPSVLFLFSGVMSCAICLIVTAAIFAPCHIMISYKNATVH